MMYYQFKKQFKMFISTFAKFRRSRCQYINKIKIYLKNKDLSKVQHDTVSVN